MRLEQADKAVAAANARAEAAEASQAATAAELGQTLRVTPAHACAALFAAGMRDPSD